MSTEIEERAIKSVPELIKINGNYVECWRNGYIRGATEQYAITKQEMIEKACRLMDEFFADGGTVDVWNRDNPDMFCGEDWFRKKMME